MEPLVEPSRSTEVTYMYPTKMHSQSSLMYHLHVQNTPVDTASTSSSQVQLASASKQYQTFTDQTSQLETEKTTVVRFELPSTQFTNSYTQKSVQLPQTTNAAPQPETEVPELGRKLNESSTIIYVLLFFNILLVIIVTIILLVLLTKSKFQKQNWRLGHKRLLKPTHEIQINELPSLDEYSSTFEMKDATICEKLPIS